MSRNKDYNFDAIEYYAEFQFENGGTINLG